MCKIRVECYRVSRFGVEISVILKNKNISIILYFLEENV